ncbi:hypothetical protein LINPERPRIM_LOCUS39317 [Linum perenne]
MSDSTNSYSSDEDEVELEDNPITKKRKNKKVAYYVVEPYVNCKCCQELEKIDPAAIDVNEHLSTEKLKEFEDEDARVRLAHYWKKLRESGGFDYDCPPFVGGRRAGIYFNGEHIAGLTKMEFMRDEAIKFGIEKYNEKTGKQMKLKKIDKLTVSQGGCHKIFFVTFIGSVVENGTTSDLTVESSDPVGKGATSNVSIESSEPVEKEDFYEAVVTYDTLNKTSDVLIFRRKSDGKDLLEPTSGGVPFMLRYPNRKACSGTIPDAVTEGLEK